MQKKKVPALSKKGGDNQQYLTERLKKNAPELYARVKKGELSVSAAAVEAGWRKPKMTILVDTADNAVRYLMKKFTKKELQAALRKVK